MNFESVGNTTEKERATNIAMRFLAQLERIESQDNQVVDMKADSGDRTHVPVVEYNPDGSREIRVWGKIGQDTGWETDLGPVPVDNGSALKAKLKNVESILELLDDDIKREVEDGISRANIYLALV